MTRARKPAPLTWYDEPDGRVIGVAGDGLVYSVEAGRAQKLQDGGYYRWHQGRRRGEWIAGLLAAKVDAERAERQRLAAQKAGGDAS